LVAVIPGQKAPRTLLGQNSFWILSENYFEMSIKTKNYILSENYFEMSIKTKNYQHSTSVKFIMGAFPICVDNEGGYGLLSCHKSWKCLPACQSVLAGSLK